MAARKMLIDELHHQDVRAALRKKYGTIADFERARGLPERSVHDVLRGRPSARVRKAIESVLIEQLNTAGFPLAQPKSERAAA